jgi:kinesin family protein 5
MGKPQSSSIRVVCRFRPQNALELEMGSENVVEVLDDNVASIQNPGQKAYRFDFDSVFDGNSRQQDVFDKTASPMVEEILQGYNSTIFACASVLHQISAF